MQRVSLQTPGIGSSPALPWLVGGFVVVLLVLGVAALFQGDANGSQPRLDAATLNPMAKSWPDPTEYEQARTAAQQAIRRAEQTRAALDEFVAQHFERWQRAANASVKPEATVSRPSQPALTLNPAWAELNERQRLSRSRQIELSERFTPLHPEVQQAENELTEVSGRLANTPQYIAEAPIAQQQPEIDSGKPSVTGREFKNRKKELSQFRAYKQAADDAMLAAGQLIELEDDAWRRHQLAWQEDRALAAEPLPAPVPATRGNWLLLPLIALLIGGAVAAYRCAVGNQMVMSMEQANRAVRAPLIAVIPSRSSKARAAVGLT